MAATVHAVFKTIERDGIADGDGIGYSNLKIRSSIWELKIKNQRFLYATFGTDLVVLAAFKKEHRKVPPDIVELALGRARRWEASKATSE